MKTPSLLENHILVKHSFVQKKKSRLFRRLLHEGNKSSIYLKEA